jgi:hypothetical protein
MQRPGLRQPGTARDGDLIQTVHEGVQHPAGYEGEGVVHEACRLRDVSGADERFGGLHSAWAGGNDRAAAVAAGYRGAGPHSSAPAPAGMC